jgi:hypothetical protein
MIEREIEAKMEESKARLAAQMDAMLAQVIEQMATRMEALEAKICVLEDSRHVSSEPEVTSVRALHDFGSPTRVIIRSSVDSRVGNTIFFLFLI